MGIKQFFKDMTREKARPLSITDENYKEVIEQSEAPVLLDVWSPNCPWCVKLMPTIHGLADKYRDVVRVADMNAAVATKAAAKLKVKGTPTVLLLRKGRVVERVVGFKPQAFFEQAMVVKFPEVFEEEA
jgi:thioredoxin-like negative regulator of GroEL